MLKNSENNGTEEIGLVAPTPDNGLVVNRQQSITWTNDDLVYWWISVYVIYPR